MSKHKIPDFQSLIPSEKVIHEIKESLCKTKNIISKQSTEIIDALLSSDCKKLLDVMETLDFKKILKYRFSKKDLDTKVSSKQFLYSYCHENKFMTPFINNCDFKMFKCASDFILNKYSLKYLLLHLDNTFFEDLNRKCIAPIWKSKNGNGYFESFKLYFDYFQSIGLFHSVRVLNSFYTFFSDHYSLVSKEPWCRKMFWYVIENIPQFKIFFSEIPLYNLLFSSDVEFVKKAYFYGLNIHSDIVLSDWDNWDIPHWKIFEFLYLAGRDAMKDLSKIRLKSRLLLAILSEDAFSNFKQYFILNGIKYNYNEIPNERIPYLDEANHHVYRVRGGYTIDSMSTMIDFARLSDKFPENYRLTMSKLKEKYGLYDKNIKAEVSKVLSEVNCNKNVIDLILSY